MWQKTEAQGVKRMAKITQYVCGPNQQFSKRRQPGQATGACEAREEGEEDFEDRKSLWPFEAEGTLRMNP